MIAMALRYVKFCAWTPCGQRFLAKRSDARFCSTKCCKRAYFEANADSQRELSRERNRRFTAAHLNEERARKREARADYREKYPDKVREANRRYLEARPDKAAEFARHRREKAAAERAARPPKPPRTPVTRKERKHGRDWQESYAQFWESQGGHCYLCGDPLDTSKPQLVVFDHHHACCPPNRSCSTCRRGLACNRCNRAIGYALDDPERLRRMADALEQANATVIARLERVTVSA